MNIEIKVERAQSYATIRDGGSYNYRYSHPIPALESEDSIWWNMRGPDEGKEKFFDFVKTGKEPDYSKEAGFIEQWLSEHGEKTGAWESTVKSKKAALAFFQGGYKDYAARITPARVIYYVETLAAYSLGTFDAVGAQKWMPLKEGNFTHEENGYLYE